MRSITKALMFGGDSSAQKRISGLKPDTTASVDTSSGTAECKGVVEQEARLRHNAAIAKKCVHDLRVGMRKLCAIGCMPALLSCLYMRGKRGVVKRADAQK